MMIIQIKILRIIKTTLMIMINKIEIIIMMIVWTKQQYDYFCFEII